MSALLAGVLTSTALYSVILFIMGSGNLSLASADSLVADAGSLGERAGFSSDLGVLIATALLAAALGLGLALFLGTDLGLAMRASGAIPRWPRRWASTWTGWSCSASPCPTASSRSPALSSPSTQGFANIQMGIGAIVTGVATLMVGETLLGRRSLGRWIAAAVVGAVVYRLAVAGALRAGLNPNALKLVTALFVLAVLVVPDLDPPGPAQP